MVCNEAKVRAQGARAAPGRDTAADRRGGGRAAHVGGAGADDHLGHRFAGRGRAAHLLRPLPRRSLAVPGLLGTLAEPAPPPRHAAVARTGCPRGAAARGAHRPVRVVRGGRAVPGGALARREPRPGGRRAAGRDHRGGQPAGRPTGARLAPAQSRPCGPRPRTRVRDLALARRCVRACHASRRSTPWCGSSPPAPPDVVSTTSASRPRNTMFWRKRTGPSASRSSG